MPVGLNRYYTTWLTKDVFFWLLRFLIVVMVMAFLVYAGGLLKMPA